MIEFSVQFAITDPKAADFFIKRLTEAMQSGIALKREGVMVIAVQPHIANNNLAEVLGIQNSGEQDG